MKKLHNMKFRVNSPEHSEEIQRELFRLGYRWALDGHNLSGLHHKFLFTTETGLIQWEDSEPHYITHINTETTLEELKLM